MSFLEFACIFAADHVAFGLFVQVGDGVAVVGEVLGVGESLENGFALFFVAGEEGGELALGQHGHAAELVEREPYGIYDHLSDVAIFAVALTVNHEQPLGFVVFDGADAFGVFVAFVKA